MAYHVDDRQDFRYLCPVCRQPRRYQRHSRGQLIFRCLAGHAWLAWITYSKRPRRYPYWWLAY